MGLSQACEHPVSGACSDGCMEPTTPTTPGIEPQEPAVRVERRGHVTLLTLNRPRALNAVNAPLSTQLGQALHEADEDREVRAVVLTGQGRAFCAGADLKALSAGASIEADGHPEWGFAGLVRHRVSVPVIAAVNGFALGGGTEIVLACDLAVMDPSAALGLPEVQRGLFAAAGGVLRLQRHLPPKLAAHAALTGEPLDAQAALRWGLVNAVSEAGQCVAQALALAERVAANAPVAVQASKRLLRDSTALDDWSDAAWELNMQEVLTVFGSADAMEGPIAFAEKRPPVWQGR